MFVGGIAFLLSIIISQMKVQNNKIKPLYILFSALLGILIVVIIYQIVLLSPTIENILSNLF